MGLGELVAESCFGRIVYIVSKRSIFSSSWDTQSFGHAELASDSLDPSRSEKTEDSHSIDKAELAPWPEGSREAEWLRGKILVQWDGPNDPHNPHNWPWWKTAISVVLICVCTTSLYMGAAIYTPAELVLESDFHTSRVKVALGLTLFVWGYGLGGLWFSPMSENPLFGGRNNIYILCQIVFTCLQIPTGLAHHIAPFAVLRFLGGVFASPPLTTGGGSLADMMPFPMLALAMIAWAYGATAGPFLGPLIGGVFVQLRSWPYIFWFMLSISGGLLVLMFFFLPETSHQAILMRRAEALRHATGDSRYVAPGDVILHTQSTSQTLRFVFLRPIEIVLKEPVLMLMNIHISLCYAVVYLYFEAFPIVFGGIYGFNYIEQGLSFLSLLVGLSVMSILYVVYMGAMRNKFEHPERVFGPSAIVGALLFPIGMLIFGWGSTHSVHWILAMCGNAIFSAGVFLIFQSYFAFIGFLYPPAAAGSAFSSSNLMRSLIGGAFPLFATVMYEHTATERWPVGWGCTITGLAGVALIPLPIYLLLRGEKLREYAMAKYGGTFR